MSKHLQSLLSILWSLLNFKFFEKSWDALFFFALGMEKKANIEYSITKFLLLPEYLWIYSFDRDTREPVRALWTVQEIFVCHFMVVEGVFGCCGAKILGFFAIFLAQKLGFFSKSHNPLRSVTPQPPLLHPLHF